MTNSGETTPGAQETFHSSTPTRKDPAALGKAMAPSETQALRVTGMTCASCVATIERALRASPGVEHATVNLATGIANVQASTATRQALVEAIKSSGYGVNEGNGPGPERVDRTEKRRLIAALALTIPLVIIAMGPHVAALFGDGMHMHGEGMDDMSGMQGMEGMEGMDGMDGMSGMDMDDEGMAPMATPYPGLQFALATPVVFVGGAPFFRGAWNALRSRHLTMDVLVATGVATAFAYSAATLFWPKLDSGQGVYFETAAVVVTLLLLGRLIEASAQRRARATLHKLASTDPGAGQLLADAQTSRMAAQDAVDRVVRYFVPAVLFIAVAASIFWMTAGAPIAEQAGFTPSSMALMSLIAVLIIACPCGLGLAVPMAVLAGTSRGAEHGIFLRGAKAAQATEGIDTVALGKTGVLTVGNPEVTDITTFGIPESELVALAGAVERDARHPVAIAIHRRASGAILPAVQEFREHGGRGAEARVDGQLVRVGRLEWLADAGVDVDPAKSQAKRLRQAAKTVVAVSRGSTLLGLIATHDAIRTSARSAIEALHARGLDTVLVSGDSPDTANALAAQLGIRRTFSRTLPEKQAATIESLQKDGRRVAVVGTPNDLDLLAQANLSIALGAGAASTDVVLTNGDLNGLLASLDLGQATLRKVRQNLAWAFGYNVLLIPVAAGLLVAWQLFGMPLRLDPMLAGAAMTLSIISVLLNSRALRRWEPASGSTPTTGSFPIGSGNPVKA